jgi:hypothetical protein
MFAIIITAARPYTIGKRLSSSSEPIGLACDQSKRFVRRSGGNDSGSTNQP